MNILHFHNTLLWLHLKAFNRFCCVHNFPRLPSDVDKHNRPTQARVRAGILQYHASEHVCDCSEVFPIRRSRAGWLFELVGDGFPISKSIILSQISVETDWLAATKIVKSATKTATKSNFCLCAKN